MTRLGRGLLLSSFLIAAPLLVTPVTAQAQTVFMVQLGTFESEEQAQEHWNTLSQAFPEVFENLSYTPNEVVTKPDNFVVYRTQAGPLPTRATAEGVCQALASSNQECYVAETAMFYTDGEEMIDDEDMADAIASAPAAATAAVPTPAPVAPAPVAQPAATSVQAGFAPANTTRQPSPNQTIQVPSAPVAAASPAPRTAQGTGMIAVEEAIPVPLSQYPSPNQNPYLERGNRLMDAHPSDSTRISSFWADIGHFKSETAAAQYVRVLKSRDPMLPSKLRIRITRPYSSIRGEQLFSLRVGPFVTTRPIRRLCGLTVQEKLRCRAVKDLGGSVRNEDRYAGRHAMNRGVTSNQYNQYRTYQDRRQMMAVNNRNAANAPVAGAGSFFVQIGSFLSPQAAEDKWRELQAQHSGLLQSAPKNIMLPMQGSNSSRLFRLRAGPYNDFGAASSLCNSLKAQGTLCIVVRR